MRSNAKIFNDYLQDAFGGEKAFRKDYFNYLILPFGITRKEFEADPWFWSRYETRLRSNKFQATIKVTIPVLAALYTRFQFPEETIKESGSMFRESALKDRLKEELIMAAIRKAGTNNHQTVLEAIDEELLQKVLVSISVRHLDCDVEESEPVDDEDDYEDDEGNDDNNYSGEWWW